MQRAAALKKKHRHGCDYNCGQERGLQAASVHAHLRVIKFG